MSEAAQNSPQRKEAYETPLLSQPVKLDDITAGLGSGKGKDTKEAESEKDPVEKTVEKDWDKQPEW